MSYIEKIVVLLEKATEEAQKKIYYFILGYLEER